MSFAQEAARSLRAAWLLFIDRPGAIDDFATGRGALRHSFVAFLLALPFYCIEIALRQGEPVVVPGGMILATDTAWLSRLVALALGWIALPVVLWLFARPLRIAETLERFVIARNWGSVLVAIAYTAIAPFPTFGGNLGEVGGILSLAVLFLVVRFVFIAARRGLGVGIVPAVGVVVVSLILGWVIDAATSALIPI